MSVETLITFWLFIWQVLNFVILYSLDASGFPQFDASGAVVFGIDNKVIENRAGIIFELSLAYK